MRAWTIRDSMELYQVPQWGRGFFGVDEQGNLVVQPRGPEGPGIALPTLLEDLRQRGLHGSTLVVVTSDHGEEFLDHGGFWHGLTLYDEQIHVPLLVKWRKDERLAPPEVNGVPARLYMLPSLDECRAHWDSSFGGPHVWEEVIEDETPQKAEVF